MTTDLHRLNGLLAGRYVLHRVLGVGGMATVYLATDLRHEREVAVKVLRTDLSAYLGTERFLKEIRITAQLDHPHILTVIDSGAAEEFLWYVLPYVRGQSLRHQIQRETLLSFEDALRITRQIGNALDYAHRKGVVHRDVKPENILLFEGEAMLTDFGIAFAAEEAGGVRLTETGISLGTPQYMSPEQASGSVRVDTRSDVFALATVLFEMLTGEPPHTGPTRQAIIAKLLTERPGRIRTIRPDVPQNIDDAVSKALSKLPADRFDSVAGFISSLISTEPPAAKWWQPGRNVGRFGWYSGVIAITALLLISIVWPDELPDVVVEPPRQVTFTGKARLASIAPDGNSLAYLDASGVVVQDLRGDKADTVLSGNISMENIEWSPAGDQLLVAGSPTASLVPRRGGARRTVGVPGALVARAHWLPDGRSISLHSDQDKAVTVIDLQSNDTTRVSVGGSYRWLDEVAWSPGGRVLLAASTATTEPVRYQIRVVTADGMTITAVDDTVSLRSPKWSRGGDTVFYARGRDEIWAVPVSSRNGRVKGEPKPIRHGLEMIQFPLLFVKFSMTADGRRVAYARGNPYSNLYLVEPLRPEAPPVVTQLTTGTAEVWSPTVSPDGQWIAFAQDRAGTAEIYRMPIAGGAVTQITIGARPMPRSGIAWSPEGDRIAFQSLRAGQVQIWIASLRDGRLHAIPGARGRDDPAHLEWAPGRMIAFHSVKANKVHVRLLDPETGAEHNLVHDSALGGQVRPRYSRDGRKLAVQWGQENKGRSGLYVFDLDNLAYNFVGNLNLIGWSTEGRYLYIGRRSIGRVDTTNDNLLEPVVTLPFDNATCIPAGTLKPRAFLCQVSDVISDVWILDREPGSN